MHIVCGTITIDFTSRVSKQVLVDDFNSMLVKIGTINLINYSNEKLELEVNSHELVYLDTESDDYSE